MQSPTSSSALRACGRLSDPVLVLSRLIVISSFAAMLAIVVVVCVQLLQAESHDGDGFVVTVVFAAVTISLMLPMAMWLLLRQGSQSVLYLRAFRSDSQGSRLHLLLKAALRSETRLCGIRPPVARVAWASRLVLNTVTGFRYLGSDQFELEAADHNWLARLLASCTRARFVLIDVRNATVNVAKEIRLAFLAMGAERCIFIVDGSCSPESPEQFVQRALEGQVSESSAKLRLLTYYGDEKTDAEAFVRDVRRVADETPDGSTGVNEEALAFARSQVAPSDWSTPVYETAWGQWLIAVALLTPASYGIYWLLARWSTTAALVPAIGLGCVMVFAYIAAWRRAWRGARFQDAFRKLFSERAPLMRLRVSLLLAVSWLAIMGIATAMLPVMNYELDSTRETLARTQLQQIRMHVQMYWTDFGKFPVEDGWSRTLAEYLAAKSDPASDAAGQAVANLLMQGLLTDPWGQAIRYELVADQPVLRSFGPDTLPNTSDDIVCDRDGSVHSPP